MRAVTKLAVEIIVAAFHPKSLANTEMVDRQGR
jgi:hypothetical protein